MVATGFEIQLDPVGEGGSYRYKNAPGQVQRPHWVDRGDTLVVQGELVECLHGRISGSDLGSLIIAEFRFLPSKNSRRFKNATIAMRMKSEDPSSADVEVINVSPQGHFSMVPTTKQLELTRSANASIEGSGAPIKPVVGLSWELKESTEKIDRTSLTGTVRLEGREYGGKNTARWTLSENSTQKTGIPTLIRTGILLKRREDRPGSNERFQAEIEIRTTVDFVSSIGEGTDKLFGRIPEDDPIIFDPKEPPLTEKFDVDINNLASKDLTELSAVVTDTMLTNTVNGKVIAVSSLAVKLMD
ncbi:MAG: hypothetical protein Q9164_002685 [Protoblastenia rupestris]